MMENNTKAAFMLGFLAAIALTGATYYYLKKNDKSAGKMLDEGIDLLGNAAHKASEALKDAQAFTQSKTRSILRDVKYHANNVRSDIEDELSDMDNRISNVAKDIKKNVEKAI